MPRGDLQKLKEILIPEACSSPTGSPSTLTVRETDAESKVAEVRITHVDEGALAIHPDEARGRGRHALFCRILRTGASLHHHKTCDHLLFVRDRGKDYVIFLELKSNSTPHLREKFLSTQCFWIYLEAVLRDVWGEQVTPRTPRYVVLNAARDSRRTLNKQATTRGRWTKDGASPELPLYRKVSQNDRLPVQELLP